MAAAMILSHSLGAILAMKPVAADAVNARRTSPS